MAPHATATILLLLLLSSVNASLSGKPYRKSRSTEATTCKLWSVAPGSLPRITSQSPPTSAIKGLDCNACAQRCIMDKNCGGMWHSQIASTLASGQTYIGRNRVLNDVCNTNKCGTTWAALSSSPSNTPAASCTLSSSKSNLDMGAAVLVSSQASCQTCMTEFLKRSEFNSVVWAGLPPVNPSKVAIVEKYGGQLTGGDGMVTGAYIPDLQAPTVAAKLCAEMGTTLKTLGDVMCKPPTPGPTPPPSPPVYQRPHRYHGSGRRLNQEAGVGEFCPADIEDVRARCAGQLDQNSCVCERTSVKGYIPMKEFPLECDAGGRRIWPRYLYPSEPFPMMSHCDKFCVAYHDQYDAFWGECSDGMWFDFVNTNCVWPNSFDPKNKCNSPGF